MKTLLRCGIAILAVTSFVMVDPALASNASKPSTPAQLIVEDGAQFFTPAKIEEAKAIVAQSMGQGSRQVHVETFNSLTPAEQGALKNATDNDKKKKFWNDWALSKTKADRGVSIFILKDPQHFEVKVDRQMHSLGFDDVKESELKKLVLNHLKQAGQAEKPETKQAEFDATLLAIANYAQTALPATTTVSGKTTGTKDTAKKDDANKGGTSIGTWICIGVCVLLGIWLVVGLIRAFSGGGGAGGPGGGGGGGFLSGLLGGLFGAMAGMWLYNSFFGGHDTSAWGGDSGGGDYGGEAGGAGDYGGDTGSGGDYGGGDAGGGGGDWGDTGGGGGDFGGGGDW